jgi:hypothetical protein
MKLTPLLLVSVSLLVGCAWLERTINRPPQPDTRTRLERGQYLDFSMTTRRERITGRNIDEFTCRDSDALFVCDGAAVVLTCTCR